MALVKTQTGVTCPYASSASKFQEARDGGSGYLVTTNNALECHGYLGLIPSNAGFSNASLIRNISVAFQARVTNATTNGTGMANKNTVSCRIMIGDTSTSNTLFSFSGNNISLTSASETGSYVGVTGKNYSTTWLNPSSAATITQTKDLLVSNAVLGVDVYVKSSYKAWNETYNWVNAVKFTYDLYIRNYVTFQGSGVVTSTTIYDHGTVPSAPTVQAATGKKFSGWRSSLDNKLYQTPPACTGYDVTYTAEYQDIDYHVGLLAVNTDNTALDVGNKLTGGGTYQIDDTFAIAADAGDTTVSGNTFLFADWTFQDANGNDMFLDESGHATHFKNEALASLTVSADTISAWWPAPAASGEHQGEYWIYGIAHYYQVYDIALSIKTDTLSDPAGLGKEGVTLMQIISDGVTHDFTKAQVVAGVTARVTNKTIEIRTTVTSAQEYSVYSMGCGGISSDKLISSWEQNTYVARGDWESSTGYFYLRFNKQYFDITINGDTDQVVKVYRIGSNNTRTLISPTHIARESKIVIEADANAMLQTTSDTAVSTISPDVSGNTSVSGGIGTITSLLQNHTIAVTRTQVTCTVTKIINSDGYDPVEEATSVVRSNPYQYIVTEESGWTISSATLTMRGTQIQSWQNVTSIDYTIQSVTGNCVLTVRRVQDPQAYVTIQTPPSHYGTVDVTSATSILKSQFTGFVIQSITALPAYEVVSATYQWIAGTTIVGTGTIDPTAGATIQYPSATIPSDQDVVLVVDVQYRKNIIYYSHKPNDPKRPQSLWYTPVGQTPQSVAAVFAQTADHKLPILLFGIPEDWIFTEQVNQNLSYTADIVRGTLMIESTGDLSSYHSAATSPWADYKDSVSVVTISDGCTGIDPNMFVDMTALETIVVPDNLADTAFPLAANTDERLNIYCRSDDEAANYTFTVEDERLVVSYGDNS